MERTETSHMGTGVVTSSTHCEIGVAHMRKDIIEEEFELPLNATLVTYTCAVGTTHYYDIIRFVKILRKIKKELNENVFLVLAGPIIDKYAYSIIRSTNDVICLGVLNKEDVVYLLSASDNLCKPNNISCVKDSILNIDKTK